MKRRKVIGNLGKEVIEEKVDEFLEELDQGAVAILEHFEESDNPEFFAVEKDEDDHLISYTKKDGSHYSHNLYSETIDDLDERVTTLEENTGVDNFENIEDLESRVEIKQDNLGRIVSYRRQDGTLVEPTGLETKEVKTNKLSLTEDGMTDFQQALKASGFNPGGAGDYSDSPTIQIPTPKLAFINISGIQAMPVTKTANMHAYMEFYDGAGNFFKKKIILNCQGNSTMMFPKKNFAFDLCEDDWEGDETTDVKIGAWVTQDSFHLKANYFSIGRDAGHIAYKLYDKILRTKPFEKRAPYMDYYSDDYTTTASGSDDIEQSMEMAARCYPDGFPVILHLNGEFYGIYVWQLKKHRDNYHMDRNAVDNIHLDGDFGVDEFWDGSIIWPEIEVRNPKPKSSKWTLLCQDGSVYDGENPKELMGTDSPYYDSSDTSKKKSAQTKENIIAFANYILEIKVFETTYNEASAADKPAALATLKEEINKRFSVEWMIDYIIFNSFLQNTDAWRWNWQWTTWGKINNKMRWNPNPYDMDQTFGTTTASFKIDRPYATYGDTSHNTPTGFIWAYFMDDIKARYAELRNKGVISYDTVIGLFLDWERTVGLDYYKKEYKKWKQSPCNRDSKINADWEWLNNSTIVYYSTTWYASGNFGINNYCIYNNRCYKSLQNNNVGHVPVSSPTWWEDVTFDEEVTYQENDVVFAGYGNFYQFKAVRETNNNPFDGYYTDGYPYEGGVYDSIYRISKWIEEKISVMDTQMTYNV